MENEKMVSIVKNARMCSIRSLSKNGVMITVNKKVADKGVYSEFITSKSGQGYQYDC
jgi:predicted RNA binding protein with dsRBD fold (UPF0201 family)